MRNTSDKFFYYAIAFLCIPLFFINVRNGHGWGDDFAQYVTAAKNFADGKPFYQSNYIFNELNVEYAPPQYPPGYSLLLAPAVKIFGIQFKPLLYINTLIFAGLFFVLFAYFRKHMNRLSALFLSVMIIYSSFMIDMKANLLSDIPCLLFTTLYLLIRNATTFSVKRKMLLIAIGIMAVLIRTQAIFLVAAEGCIFLYDCVQQWRQQQLTFKWTLRHPAIVVGPAIVVLFFLLNATVFKTPSSTLRFYISDAMNHGEGVWHTVGRNAGYLLSLFLEFFYYEKLDPFWQPAVTIIQYSILVFALVGFLMRIRKGLQVDDFFFIFICVMQLLFPPHQGPRYIAQLIPVYLLFAYQALSITLPNVLGIKARVLAICFFVFYLAMGCDSLQKFSENKCDGCLISHRDSVVFNYINTHVPDSDIIICSKPRGVTLFTNKRTMIYAWQKSFEENKKKFDSLGAKYMLTIFEDGTFIHDYLESTHSVIDSQFIIDGAYLMRLR